MKKSAVFLFFVLASCGVFAAHPDKHPGSDNSSGCGLGWKVSKRKSLLSSSSRASTNSIGSQSIAMTMGTSGCSKHELAKLEKEQEHFANSNFEHVLVDMAQGKGVYLNAFASMVGCDAEVLGSYSQAHFDKVMAENGVAFLNNVKAQINSNAALGAACII